MKMILRINCAAFSESWTDCGEIYDHYSYVLSESWGLSFTRSDSWSKNWSESESWHEPCIMSFFWL
jgi:hypothetical protein